MLAWKPRPRALTTPVVSVRSNPKGLPMARQACPTRTAEESPSVTGRSRETGALTLSTARSRALSAPAQTGAGGQWQARLIAAGLLQIKAGGVHAAPQQPGVPQQQQEQQEQEEQQQQQAGRQALSDAQQQQWPSSAAGLPTRKPSNACCTPSGPSSSTRDTLAPGSTLPAAPPSTLPSTW